MPKPQNVGAINARPPKDPTKRAQYLRCKDLATAEFKRNKQLGAGPRNFGEQLLEMWLVRYADHFADDRRVAPQPKPLSEQTARPSIFAGLGGDG